MKQSKCDRLKYVKCDSIHSLNTLSMKRFGVCAESASTQYKIKSLYSDTRVVFLGKYNSVRITYCTDMYFHLMDFCVDKIYFGRCDNLFSLASKGEIHCFVIYTPENSSYILNPKHFTRCPKDIFWVLD